MKEIYKILLEKFEGQASQKGNLLYLASSISLDVIQYLYDMDFAITRIEGFEQKPDGLYARIDMISSFDSYYGSDWSVFKQNCRLASIKCCEFFSTELQEGLLFNLTIISAYDYIEKFQSKD